MRHLIVLILLGISCNNVFARTLKQFEGLDLERRLLRLEARQLSDSDNIERRLLRLENQMAPQQDAGMFNAIELAPNVYTIFPSRTEGEPPVEQTNFVEELKKVEQKLEKDLGGQLAELSSKYDSLSEKLSNIEKQETAPLKDFPYDKFMAHTKAIVIKSDQSEPIFSAYEKIGEKNYYIEKIEKLDWPSAVRKCKELDGQLVSLKSEKEWREIKNHLDLEKSYWTDVNDIKTEGEFVSNSSIDVGIDEDSLSFFRKKKPFLKWNYQEPNNLNREDCVELRGGYYHKMNDINCFNKNYFICEEVSVTSQRENTDMFRF
ncbi:CD209 antigen-like protein B [Drosophila elegans]|uniref:CD209 antigen-like protein B n=1 Tax=Drosophila elegans TaxID=30023 RepID=UPI0007E7FF5C|nr:CD209 antigen-like protein B [Drosophila elegans]